MITQYHTSVMFAPNVVGTANAASAGWGNSGGGVTQSVMPWVLAALLSLGIEKSLGWRMAMIVPSVLMIIVGVMYWKFTQDCPQGDYQELRRAGHRDRERKKGRLAGIQGRHGQLSRLDAVRHLLARASASSCSCTTWQPATTSSTTSSTCSCGHGGRFVLACSLCLRAPWAALSSDRVARARGLDARTFLLFALMVGEGFGLLWFSTTSSAVMAITAMITFGLFTHMACGATYALVPFIDRKALGGVAGIIGAGGNVGAVAAGGFYSRAWAACRHASPPWVRACWRIALRHRRPLQCQPQGSVKMPCMSRPSATASLCCLAPQPFPAT